MIKEPVSSSSRCLALPRCIARILGIFGFIIVLMFTIGEGFPLPWNEPGLVQIEMGATILMVLGMAVGWRWELPGALLVVVGWVTFAAAEKGSPPWLYNILLVGALLYLYSACRDRRVHRPANP